MHYLPRREFIVQGGAALAALASFQSRIASAFPSRAGEEVIKWLDQLPPNPVPEVIKNQLVWEDLDSWVTPNDKFFSIAHFDRPVIDESTWKLEIGGSVKKPTTLTLADIKARPRQEVTFTVECSGNTGLPFFNGGIGNARWAGTPLAPILKEAGVLDTGIEVVFWGTDKGEIKRADDVKFTQNFARSMSLADAMDPKNILCYEMNGSPCLLTTASRCG
ncbi:molybdopterin-dependent oxidoreductase [Mesorhizobium sp. B2-4-1]|uniref:molybdopterin-dependent oxidoreductase n=1 Tax=Mesorhizobium sp. B2-4-1 TaxID=2589948 RepID=UPI001FEDEAD4|nr:molybdopterin-dependent oxidoreductase [Mesorhizobium sp. B2-4-1]